MKDKVLGGWFFLIPALAFFAWELSYIPDYMRIGKDHTPPEAIGPYKGLIPTSKHKHHSL